MILRENESFRKTILACLVFINSPRGIQERRDSGQKGFRTGGIQKKKDTVKEVFETGGIRDWRDTGKLGSVQEGCGIGEMRNRRDAR